MKTAIVAGFCGFLAAGVLVAEPPNGNPDKRRGRPPRGDQRDFFAQMLERMDTDRNGAISFAEFAATERVEKLTEEQRRQLFDRIDKNKDGAITREDVARGPGEGSRPWERRPGPNLDANKDGKVSLEEFRKSPRVAGMEAGKQEKIFRMMDRNKDGFLDGADRRGRRPGPGGGGGPQRGPMWGAKMFEELDADGNGSLSFEEFRKGPRAQELDEDRQEDLFEKLDRDDDGVLKKGELIGPRGPGMGPGRGPGGSGTGRGKRPKPEREGERVQPDG